MLFTLMPGTRQLIHYNPSHLSMDITAGLIVAILLIPQSMAYAIIAGVPLTLGLYAATFPLIIYALFGSSRYLSVGPVSIVSLLAFTGISSLSPHNSAQFLELMILLGLMIGVVQIFMGLIKVGSFFDYISSAVISGFTSAAAIIIALNQVKSILGVEIPSYHGIIAFTEAFFNQLPHANLYTVLIGLGSFLLLYLFKKIFPTSPGPFIVIILSIILVDYFNLDNKSVNTVGDIPTGLPSLSFQMPTLDMIVSLLPIAFMIGFISFVESYSVAKALAIKENDQLNSNQELVGLGLANITSSLFGSIPVAGAFSRTAVNYQSGAKSNLSLIITAIFMIVALLYLTPFFYYLPTAALAAIIIVAVSGLINVKGMKECLTKTPLQAVSLFTTFISTLVIDIFIGLVIGIFVSLFINFLKRFLFFPTYSNTK